MGCAESAPEDIPTKPTSVKATQVARSSSVEVKITNGEFEEATLRVLVLGSGDSGKTTLCRQIDNIYTGTFPAKVVEIYTKQIRQNLITDVKLVLQALDKAGVYLSDELAKIAHLIRSTPSESDNYTSEIASGIAKLWADQSFKESFYSIKNDNLFENEDVLIAHAEEFAPNDYKATNEQVLEACIPTFSFDRHALKFNQYEVEIIEVGGQKTQRENWHKYYKDVDAIIYVASLSNFGQALPNEPGSSQANDSLTLFSQIAADPAFAKTPICLVLNKSDVFAKKLQKNIVQFKSTYAGFTGAASDVDLATKHVTEAYLRQVDTDRPADAWIMTTSLSSLDKEAVENMMKKFAPKVYLIAEKSSSKKKCLKPDESQIQVRHILKEPSAPASDAENEVEPAPFTETVRAKTVKAKEEPKPEPKKEEPKPQPKKEEKKEEKKHDAKKAKKSSSDSDSESGSYSYYSYSSSK